MIVMTKPAYLVRIALWYIASVAIVNLIMKASRYDKPGIALAVGAVIGTQVAVWFHARNERGRAPVSAKVSIGALMAGVCILQSFVFQALWHWMDHPAITIAVSAIGSFVCPLMLFESLRKRTLRSEVDD
jgi:hypothetical protein